MPNQNFSTTLQPGTEKAWSDLYEARMLDHRHLHFQPAFTPLPLWRRVIRYPGRLRRALTAARRSFAEDMGWRIPDDEYTEV